MSIGNLSESGKVQPQSEQACWRQSSFIQSWFGSYGLCNLPHWAHRPARYRLGVYFRFHAEYCSQQSWGHHLFWCALRHNMSVCHYHQLIAVPASLIKVVQHSDHRFPLSPEFAHQPHQVHLVIDIKIGGWLIK